jgi:hypothetical protein
MFDKHHSRISMKRFHTHNSYKMIMLSSFSVIMYETVQLVWNVCQFALSNFIQNIFRPGKFLTSYAGDMGISYKGPLVLSDFNCDWNCSAVFIKIPEY